MLLNEIDPYAAEWLTNLVAAGLIPPAIVEKYGADNWRKIDQRDHLNHAMVHIVKFMAGDRSESHLVNAICRLMFAEAVGSES